MNFGFPFTPYQTAGVGQDFFEPTSNSFGYMGNVGTPYPTQMGYLMPNSGTGCGCNNSVNQVVNKCFVEELPYYVNYHTHQINNVIRRHIQIPTFSTSEETVYFDEWQTGCNCGCNR